jgi:hypothetical protein
MDNPEVTYYLLPLPASSRGDYAPVRDNFRDRSSPKGKGYRGSKGSGKGGKGKSSKGRPPVNPESYGWPAGAIMKSKGGKQFCYAFNSTTGCKFGKPGSICRMGIHLCMKYGCEGRHPAHECKPKAN